METYDLLQVAGREWRTLCHSSDFAAKEKSLLGGTGPSSGIRRVPKGGVNAPGKTLKLCLEWLTTSIQTEQGGVRFPKTLWVSDLKLGAVGGARLPLIRARGLPLFRSHLGPTLEHLVIFKTQRVATVT